MLGKMVACSCHWGKEMQQEEDGQKAKSSKDFGWGYESPKASSSFPNSVQGWVGILGKSFSISGLPLTCLFWSSSRNT